MIKIHKIFGVGIFLTTVLAFLTFPSPVSAQRKAEAESISVTATIPSPVSPSNSYSELNTNETLADPAHHWIILTVYLKDKDKKPLPNREVKVTSNRGQVDIIEAFSKIRDLEDRESNLDGIDIEKTDDKGRAVFRITSFAPGEVELKIIADSLIELKPQRILFSPLPLPFYLTIKIYCVLIDKEWIIYAPFRRTEGFTLAQQKSRELINPGLEIRIPVWFILLSLLYLIGLPILVFRYLIKIRKTEKEQILLLRRIAEAQDIENLKDGIRKDGIDKDGILKQ